MAKQFRVVTFPDHLSDKTDKISDCNVQPKIHKAPAKMKAIAEENSPANRSPPNTVVKSIFNAPRVVERKLSKSISLMGAGEPSNGARDPSEDNVTRKHVRRKSIIEDLKRIFVFRNNISLGNFHESNQKTFQSLKLNGKNKDGNFKNQLENHRSVDDVELTHIGDGNSSQKARKPPTSPKSSTAIELCKYLRQGVLKGSASKMFFVKKCGKKNKVKRHRRKNTFCQLLHFNVVKFPQDGELINAPKRTIDYTTSPIRAYCTDAGISCRSYDPMVCKKPLQKSTCVIVDIPKACKGCEAYQGSKTACKSTSLITHPPEMEKQCFIDTFTELNSCPGLKKGTCQTRYHKMKCRASKYTSRFGAILCFPFILLTSIYRTVVLRPLTFRVRKRSCCPVPKRPCAPVKRRRTKNKHQSKRSCAPAKLLQVENLDQHKGSCAPLPKGTFAPAKQRQVEYQCDGCQDQRETSCVPAKRRQVECRCDECPDQPSCAPVPCTLVSEGSRASAKRRQVECRCDECQDQLKASCTPVPCALVSEGSRASAKRRQVECRCDECQDQPKASCTPVSCALVPEGTRASAKRRQVECRCDECPDQPKASCTPVPSAPVSEGSRASAKRRQVECRCDECPDQPKASCPPVPCALVSEGSRASVKRRQVECRCDECLDQPKASCPPVPCALVSERSRASAKRRQVECRCDESPDQPKASCAPVSKGSCVPVKRRKVECHCYKSQPKGRRCCSPVCKGSCAPLKRREVECYCDESCAPISEGSCALVPKGSCASVPCVPVCKESCVPVFERACVPVSKKSCVTVFIRSCAPIFKKSRIPVPKRLCPWLSKNSRAPVSKGSDPPVSKGSRSPVSKGSGDPVSKRSRAPVSKGSRAPVSKGSGDPVSKKSRAPVSKGSRAVVSKGSGDPESKGPGAPVSKGQRDPVSKRSSDPVSRRPRAPVSKGAGHPVSKGSRDPVSKGSRAPEKRRPIRHHSCDCQKMNKHRKRIECSCAKLKKSVKDANRYSRLSRHKSTKTGTQTNLNLGICDYLWADTDIQCPKLESKPFLCFPARDNKPRFRKCFLGMCVILLSTIFWSPCFLCTYTCCRSSK